MGELELLFSKIGAGIKTKAAMRAYKMYVINKKVEASKVIDANNMYPEDPSLAKKKE